MRVQQKGILIVDGDHLFHRNWHANNTLQTSFGLQSGAFFGFINSILKLQQHYGFQRTYITWGGKRSDLKRRKHYADYKITRDSLELPEAFYTQKNDLISFLSYLNIPQFMHSEYEGDDIIVFLISELTKTVENDYHFFILTGDKDLLQLVNRFITVIKPSKKGDIFITPENINQYFPIKHPRHIIPYLALLGDSSDNIPGVYGLGPRSVLDLMLHFSEDDTSLMKFKMWPLDFTFRGIKDSIVDKIYANLANYFLSLDLIDLIESPLSILKDRDVGVLNLSNEKQFSETAAQSLLDKYEIKTVKAESLILVDPRVVGFTGERKFLSNFYSCLIAYKDFTFSSVEHFYQAMKTKDVSIWMQINKLSASEAKKFGKTIKLRDDWEQIKIKVMLYALRQKFSQDPLKQQLIDTGNEVLIEYNYWHDNFWGDCTCDRCSAIEGQNHLGKLLMQVRNELTRPQQPTRVNPRCAKCPELVKNRSNIVPNKFVPNADILFVAEAPGATEDIEGIEPLTGESGKELNKWLEANGIDRSKVSLANVCMCRPQNNREPTKQEIQNCLPNLLHDIEYYKPRVIIPLGRVALGALTEGIHTGIQNNRGRLIQFRNWNLIPTWHPSYVCTHAPAEQATAIRDIGKALKFLRGEKLTDDVNYRVIMDVDELRDYVERMKQSSTIAFDYETAGFDPGDKKHGGEILCISLSAKPFEAVVFPFRGQFLRELRPEEENKRAREILREFFEGYPNIVKIAHNAKFEFVWTVGSGIAKDIKNLQDTMLLHYLIDENSVHNLKDLGVRFTDVQKYDEETHIWKKRSAHKKQPYYDSMPDFGDENFAYIPEDKLWEYACIDADVTHRLYPIFMKEIVKQDLTKFTFNYFLPLVKFFGHVKLRGIKIDTSYLNNLIDKYQTKYKEEEIYLRNLPEVKKAEKLIYQRTIEKQLAKIKERYSKLKKKRLTEAEYLQKYVYDKVKKEPINFDSSDQLAILFLDVLKLKKYTTDKGNVKLDVGVLEIYEQQGIPFVKHLMNYRRLGKFLSTFLIGIRNVLVYDRVMTDLLQHGAVTGRLSSKNPNLQNIPNKSDPEKAKEIRRMFIVDDADEYVFLARDYGQIEFRIWAQYSQDEVMIEDLRSGLDIHRLTASRVYGVPIEEVTSEQRTKAKGVVFGIMYGRGARSIAKAFGISEEEAEQIRVVFFGRYPKAKAWLERTLNYARRYKHVRNLYGRIRHLHGKIDSKIDGVRAEAERQAVNSPIQGGASDTNNLAAYKCDKALRRAGIDAEVRLLVHDQIIFHVRKTQLHQAYELTNEIMLHPDDIITVPLTTDAEVGINLGDMIDYAEYTKQ